MQRIKKIISWALVLVATIYTGVVGMKIYQFYFPEGGFQPACPQETKTCEDGTIIRRTDLSCDLADCPEPKYEMDEDAAKKIAEKNCIKGGEELGDGEYNEETKTWWFDANLNAKRNGCNPACVVSEETKKAEINWRCTGLLKK